MSAQVTWARGGQAQVLSLEPDAIVLSSTVPSPPGSRIEGTLAFEPPARLRVKIHGCRRTSDGAFTLEGRPIDLPREVRERVVAALPPRSP